MKDTLAEQYRNGQTQRRSVRSIFAQRLRALESRYSLLAQSLFSILDQAIVSGTSFLSEAIICRLTTPDKLGLYYLFLSIVIIASAVQDAAISVPYMVYCRRREGRELAEYSGSVWIHHLGLWAMSVVLLLAIIAVMIV